MNYRIGDKVVRTSIGGKGQKGEIVAFTDSSTVYKVELADTGNIQQWHDIHFKKDGIPEFKLEPKPGDMVIHTEIPDCPVACITGQSEHMKTHWLVNYTNSQGKVINGSWKKDYCVLARKKANMLICDDIEPRFSTYTNMADYKRDLHAWQKRQKPLTATEIDAEWKAKAWGKFYNPCQETRDAGRGLKVGDSLIVSSARRSGKSVAFAEAMKYSQHIMSNMVNPPLIETTRPEDYLRQFTTSEEDKPMQLLIQDKVTINGVDATNMSDDTLIDTIRQAEDQINSYKAIKAESNAITAKIRQLEEGVKRLVELLDKE